MPLTDPPALTDPTTAPSTMSPSTFSPRMDAWIAWMAIHVPQMVAVLAWIRDTAAAVLGYATAAAADAGTATTKRDEAVAAAGTATTKAGEASASASAAAQSVIDCEALLDQFDDRYLGIKATDPTVDNDGNALQAGAIYINSATGYLRAYNGTSWVQGISALAGVESINGQQGALSLKTLNAASLLGSGNIDVASLGANTYSGPQNEARGADIASASTIDLSAATGNLVDVTGTTTITAITLGDGYERTVRFTGALTLTHGASLALPGAANITTAAGDFAVFRGYAAGVVRCVAYTKASGLPVAAPAAGAWMPLSVVTASNSATIDIDTTLDGTYDLYAIVAVGLLPATTNADLYVRLKVGGAYDTGNNYRYVGETSAAGVYRGHYDNGASQSAIRVSDNSIYKTAASDTGQIVIFVPTPASTTIRKYITWTGGGVTDAGNLYKLHGVGMNAATTVLTGVRLYMHNGNIASGTFRLYGIKNS